MELARRSNIGRWLWLVPIAIAGTLALGVFVSVRLIEVEADPGNVAELDDFLTAIDAAVDDTEHPERVILTARLATAGLEARSDILAESLGEEQAGRMVDAVRSISQAAEQVATGEGDRETYEAAKAQLLAAVVDAQNDQILSRQSTIDGLIAVILALVAILGVGGLGAALGTWTSERALRRLRAEEREAQVQLAAQNEELAFAARHDALTGLLNRGGFFDHLASVLVRAREEHAQVAVILADMDRFKTLNDIRGHHAADSVLQEIARRLEGWAGDGGVAGRIGGDEFAIVVEAPSVATFEDRLGQLTSALSERISIDGITIQPGMSLGVAVFPNDGASVDDLTRHADLAMYEAKRSGGARWSFFSPALGQQANARHVVEVTLADAVEQGELLLEYQPIVSLATGELFAVEALVRWQHPEQGLIPPASFIPVAEESGSMMQLGDWVLREALRETRLWHERGWPVPVSVNLSPVQLRRADFAEYVRALVEDSGVPPQMVMLEITESSTLDDQDGAVKQLRALREYGVAIALDDFGDGKSSLTRLKSLPIDAVKVDRSLVADIGTPGHGDAIVEAAVTLCHRMKLQVIVEGVETADQLRAVHALGGLAAQGHYLYRPVAAPAVRELLASQPLVLNLGAA